MEIRPIDFDSDVERHEFYTVLREAELAENSDRATWSEEEMIAHFTEPDDAEEGHAFGAFTTGEGRRLVGGGFVFYPLLDNTEKAYAGLGVDPARQGRGIGSALVEYLLRHTAAHDRTTVLTQATYGFDRRDDHPYRRFAEKHGFSLASTEVSRRLDLPVPTAQLDAWIDEAEPHHAGYQIETFIDDVPDALLPSVCHVLGLLAVEAPTGDLEFEAEQVTPEIRRQHDARNKRTGLRRYETVGIDESGTAVAVTTIGVPAEPSNKMHQWATIVEREHRGHRLGLALKARNLKVAQEHHPDRIAIHTQNNETNAPMVDINERMGFKPIELCAEFQHKLDG